MMLFCRSLILKTILTRANQSHPLWRFQPYLKLPCAPTQPGWTIIVRRREVFRLNLSRIVLSVLKCPTKYAFVPVLGYHKDGLRHVLFHKPKMPEVISEEKVLILGFFERFFHCLWKIFEVIKIIGRTLNMCLLVSPLVITAPLALKYDRFQKFWFKLLISTIEMCGPVYVKLGQWASTRRDIFPPKICFHLSKLQRNAQTHPWKFTQEVLDEAFGPVRVAGLLTEVDQVPIGSGCCAQVYSGLVNVTHLSLESRKQLEPRVRKNAVSGQGYGVQLPVAIKVLHPEIAVNFARDLNLLKSMVAFLSVLFPSLEWLSLKESINEFASLMEIQIDLTHEAENLLQFGQDFANDSRVVFPIPILELCRSNVIVETYESGLPLETVVNRMEEMPKEARTAVANAGVEMLLKMVFRHNYVHGDLHPGNLMVRGLDLNLAQIPNEQVQLIILDPGIVASLAPKDLANFKAVFTAVARQDGRKVGELFLQQSANNCFKETEFINEMELIVKDALSQQLSLAKLDVANLLSRVFATLRSHRVKLDPNFTSVILAIMVLEGLGRSLDPELDLLWKATPYLIRSG